MSSARHGRRRPWRGGPAAGALLVAAALCLGACGESGPGPWLGRVEQRSEDAEAALSRGELAAARAELQAIVAGEPQAGLNSEDLRHLRQDTYFRLAELELQARAPAAALRWTEQGLALGAGPDLFVANLWLSQGRARERLGQRAEAVAAYAQALRVNEVLLDRLLDAPAEVSP